MICDKINWFCKWSHWWINCCDARIWIWNWRRIVCWPPVRNTVSCNISIRWRWPKCWTSKAAFTIFSVVIIHARAVRTAFRQTLWTRTFAVVPVIVSSRICWALAIGIWIIYCWQRRGNFSTLISVTFSDAIRNRCHRRWNSARRWSKRWAEWVPNIIMNSANNATPHFCICEDTPMSCWIYSHLWLMPLYQVRRIANWQFGEHIWFLFDDVSFRYRTWAGQSSEKGRRKSEIGIDWRRSRATFTKFTGSIDNSRDASTGRTNTQIGTILEKVDTDLDKLINKS